MKQEFVTSKGKVIFERNVLFFRYMKLYFSETVLYKFIFGVLPFIALILFIVFFDEPSDIIRVLMWFFFMASNYNHLLDILYRLSFSNRIMVSKIVDVKMEPAENGLETNVILLLKSKRKRIIPFRTLEKQHESFFEFITQQIAPAQLA